MPNSDKKVFSLEKLQKELMKPFAATTYSNEMFQRVNELYYRIHRTDDQFNLYEEYTREEIEWFVDAMYHWPIDSDDDGYSLQHIIIQNMMIGDIMQCISTAKKTRKKGKVFI